MSGARSHSQSPAITAVIELPSTSILQFPRHNIRIEAHFKVLFSSPPISQPMISLPEAHPARLSSNCRCQERRAGGERSTMCAMANHDSAIVHVSPRTCTARLKST
jgi:hypothetical protein